MFAITIGVPMEVPNLNTSSCAKNYTNPARKANIPRSARRGLRELQLQRP